MTTARLAVRLLFLTSLMMAAISVATDPKHFVKFALFSLIACGVSIKFLWQLESRGESHFFYAIIDKRDPRWLKVVVVVSAIFSWLMGFILLIPGVNTAVLRLVGLPQNL